MIWSNGNFKNRDTNFLSLDKLNQKYIESDSEYVSKYLIISNQILNKMRIKAYMSLGGLIIFLSNSYDIMDPLDYIKWQNFLLKYPEVIK